MKAKEKPTKTEGLILVLAAAFLLVLVLSYRPMASSAQGTDYTIYTQYRSEDILPTGEEEELLPAPEVQGPVDVNTANLEELQTLPGVGPVLAERIIGYREANGPFRSLEDLLNVKGIGEATLAELRDSAAVGSAQEKPEKYEEEEAAA